jgi:NAD(P)-dependent dehydrogenase (short-subunit alcohol dehydrogenase family)
MPGNDHPISGKVCLVTGATAGIGAVTARELARRGATVVLVGRNREKTEATTRRIRDETGNPAVEFLLADLSAQAEVRRLAEQFRQRHPRLDVLINNAGAFFSQRRESPDGIELTLALNHLAYFLLTNLLVDALRASAPAQIVNVASNAHQGAQIDFDDLQGRRRYSGIRAYAQSKLANVLFTYELARRLEGTRVTANALHPGFVATSFFEGNGWFGWVTRRLAGVLALSPEQGARTSIYLATAPEVEGVSGRYFVKEKEAASSRASHDEAAARRLWQVSEELTGLSAAHRA